MKVLEEAQGWSIEQFCTGKGNGNGGCGSKLLVEKNDIYLTSHTDLTGDTEYFYTFCCPVCGIETDIPSENLPISIKNNLLNYKGYQYVRRRSWR